MTLVAVPAPVYGAQGPRLKPEVWVPRAIKPGLSSALGWRDERWRSHPALTRTK